jgi:catechol-2,3-dioxygenase
MRTSNFVAALGVFLFAHCNVFAQLTTPNDSGISIGHIHLYSKDPEAQKKIWTEAFGAQVTKTGTLELLRLPGVFNIEVQGPFVSMPDGLRLELLEEKAQTSAVVMHHIHLAAVNGEKLRQWYVKTFGAEVGSRRNLPSAMFNGNEVDFLPAQTAPAPTKGRAIDHIGFEVKNLEAFMKKLQEEGVTIEIPYRDVPNIGLKIGFVTDPVGTRIELTEGLTGK